jgi:hypothetical protein
MTGLEKLAVILVGTVLTLSALSAGGQQTSNAAEDTSPGSAAPPPVAPRWPENMPANPPKVTCNGDNLTITAQNSTLGAVLNAIRICTGVQFDVPQSAKEERLFAELGPGPIRAVLADFLSSTDFNYVVEASPTNPQKIQAVLLNPRSNDSLTEVAAKVAPNTDLSPNRLGWLAARHNYVQSFTASHDGSSQEADASPTESAPVESAAPVSSIPVEPAPVNSPPVDPAPTDPAPTDPAPTASAVAIPATTGIAPVSADSGSAPSQGKSTQEMINDMQRMFEQRKQMVQQQQSAPVH